MGVGVISINDPAAELAIESPRKPTKRIQLHLVLSPQGSADLLGALRYAEVRERKTRIVVNCDSKQRKPRFRFLRCLTIEIPEKDSEAQLAFAEQDSTATIALPRHWIPSAVELCESMQSGVNDVSFKFGERLAIWAWGGGSNP